MHMSSHLALLAYLQNCWIEDVPPLAEPMASLVSEPVDEAECCSAVYLDAGRVTMFCWTPSRAIQAIFVLASLLVLSPLVQLHSHLLGLTFEPSSS